MLGTSADKSNKSPKYYSRSEASHVFLYAKNYNLFQQGDRLNWQIFRLNTNIQKSFERQFECQILNVSNRLQLHIPSHLSESHSTGGSQNHLSIRPAHTIGGNSSESSGDGSMISTAFGNSFSYSEDFVVNIEESDSSLDDSAVRISLSPPQFQIDLRIETEKSTHDAVLAPKTEVFTLYAKYKVVFSIDLSPSMMVIDPINGDVIFDRVAGTLAKMLTALCEPVQIPDSQIEIKPEIHISIIGQGSYRRPIVTICQDMIVNKENLNDVIQYINHRLKKVEDDAAIALAELKITQKDKHWYSSDFNVIIQNALVAFGFLPKDAAPVLVILSDCVFNFPNINKAISDLVHNDITFSIVNFVPKNRYDFSYGYIYNTDILEFIVRKFGGTLIDWSFFNEKKQEEKSKIYESILKHSNSHPSFDEIRQSGEKNRNVLLHFSLFFKRSSIKIVPMPPLYSDSIEQSLMMDTNKSSETSRLGKKIKSYKLKHVELNTLLKLRVRAGFVIEDIVFPTSESIEEGNIEPILVEMKMCFRPNIEIEYIVKIISNEEHFIEDSEKSFNTLIPPEQNYSTINVTIVLNAPKNFKEEFDSFFKRYKPGMHSERDIYSLLADFIHSIYVLDKTAQNFHDIAKNYISKTMTNRQKMSSSLIRTIPPSLWCAEESLILFMDKESQFYGQHVNVDTLVNMLVIKKRNPSPETMKDNRSAVSSTIMSLLSDTLGSSSKIADDLCVHFISNAKDHSLLSTVEGDGSLSPGFCLLRLVWHSHHTAEFELKFFNVLSSKREQVIGRVKEVLSNLEEPILKNVEFRPSVKPVICKILRHLPRGTTDLVQYYKQKYRQPPQYSSYLTHTKWMWSLADNASLIPKLLNVIISERLREGFSLLEFQYSLIFVKELESNVVKQDENSPPLHAFLFYSVHVLRKSKQLITEIWLEPQSGYLVVGDEVKYLKEYEVFEYVKNWIYQTDTDILSSFWTFDEIYKACSKENENDVPPMLKMKENVEPPFTPIPFNVDKVCKRSIYDTVEFVFYKLPSKEDTKKLNQTLEANNELLNRLIRFVSLLNNIEVPIDSFLWEEMEVIANYFKIKQIPQCFAKELGGEGTFLLTFIPKKISNNDNFVIHICACASSQLSSLSFIKQPKEEIYESLFNIEKPEKKDEIKQIAQLSTLTLETNLTNLDIDQISDGYHHYRHFLKEMHSLSFAYGVYKSLCSQEHVELSNVARAIESCIEYVVEIDLTEYVEAVMTSKGHYFKQVGDGPSPIEQTKKYFESIIHKYFERIPNTEYHYYYRDQEKKYNRMEHHHNVMDVEVEGSDDSEGEGSYNTETFSDEESLYTDNNKGFDELYTETSSNSTSALIDKLDDEILDDVELLAFMRIQCVSFDTLKQKTTKIPTTTIPIEEITNKKQKVNPLQEIQTQTETDSWILSTVTSSAKTVLHLICITLPPDKFPIAINGFSPDTKTMRQLYRNFVANSFAYSRSKFTNNPQQLNSTFLSSKLLPKQLRSAMRRTKKRIKALISTDILNAFLHTTPTVYTIEKVNEYINNLPPSCYTKHTIELEFVAPQEGQQLFKKELVKCDYPIIKKIGNFHVVFFKRKKGEEWYATSPVQKQEEEEDDDEEEEEEEEEKLELPYWILLTTKGSQVNILFYSPYSITKLKKCEVFETLENGIRRVCKRVNQLILLADLNATRLCSSLLIPPTKSEREKLEKGIYEKSSFDSNTKFKEGEFECSNVHSILFGLHKRLVAKVAIRDLATGIFYSFIVHNREVVFVYRESDGKVFYMKLSEVSPKRDDQKSEEPYSLSFSGEGNTLYGKFSFNNSDKEFLRLDVFGVDKPGPEITIQLQRLVENKLAASTLSSITQHLRRNPKSKLTLQDEEFLRPSDKAPDTTAIVPIPNFVKFPFLFLLLLRQNLLIFLKRLYLTPVKSHIKENDELSTDDEGQDDVTQTDTYLEFNALQFRFLYYNAMIRNHPSFGRGIAYFPQGNGTGITCIDLCVLDGEGKIVTHFAPFEEDDDNKIPTQWENVEAEYVDPKIYDILSNEFPSVTNEEDAPKFRIVMKMWGKGEFNCESLVQRIVQTINQTLCDYVLETKLFPTKVQPQSYRETFLEPFNHIMKQVSPLNIPTIKELRIRIFLPLWTMKDFVTQLREIISKFNLSTNVLVSIDSGKTFSENGEINVLNGNQVIFSLLSGFGTQNMEIHEALPLYHHVTYKHHFKYNRKIGLFITITNTEMIILGYNIKPEIMAKLKMQISRLASWTKCRVHLLNSILHQKMGLHFHSISSNLASAETASDQRNATSYSEDVRLTLQNIDVLINTVAPQTTQEQQITTPPDKKSTHFHYRKNDYFGILLKDVYYDEADQIIPKKEIKSKDPLHIHGSHFKRLITIHNYKMKKETKITAGCASLNRVHHSVSPSLMKTDFSYILKTSRLFHLVRIPFFFNKLRDILTGKISTRLLADIRNLSKSGNVQKLAKYRQLLESFLEEYISYLKQLGLTLLAAVDGTEKQEDEPTQQGSAVFEIDGEYVVLPPTTVYLEKVYEGGVLLIELGFDKIYASLNMYISDPPKKMDTMNIERNEWKNQRVKFLQSVGHIKHALHLNSFIYDFQIRHFERFMKNKYYDYPDFDFVEMIQAFYHYYPRAPGYSRNALIVKDVQVKLPEPILIHQLFEFICQKKERNEDREIPGVIILPSIQKGLINFKGFATLVPKKEIHNECSDKMELRLYLFFVDIQGTMPHEESKSMKNRTQSFEPIIEEVDQHIQQMCEINAKYFKLENLWKSVMKFDASLQDLSILMSLCLRRDLTTIDSTLSTLFSSQIPWKMILDELQKIYEMNAGFIGNEENRNVTFMIKDVSEQCMLVIEYTLLSNSIQTWICRRDIHECCEEMELTKIECDLISEFVNRITHLLFKICMNDLSLL